MRVLLLFVFNLVFLCGDSFAEIRRIVVLDLQGIKIDEGFLLSLQRNGGLQREGC